MTTSHALTPDGLAVLALTSRWHGAKSNQTGSDDAQPLAPKAWARVARALEAVGARPADLLGRESADLVPLLGGATAAAEVVARLAARATTLAMEVERLEGRGIWLVSVVDDAYPVRLRVRLGDAAPPILYGAGAVELLEGGGVAIVGARDADGDSLEYAWRAAGAVARSGSSVVSGGAKGIDAAAMSAAAEAGGSVVGVLADSLERQARSTAVRTLVGDERLVLVSSYGADVPFSVGNAMGRNRLIYCLADSALVVVTAQGTGGTWAGATEALSSGWVPVYARTGTSNDTGARALVARGAVGFDDEPEMIATQPRRDPGAATPAGGGDGEPGALAEQQTLFEGDPVPVPSGKRGSTRVGKAKA
jgi:DNA processing protein